MLHDVDKRRDNIIRLGYTARVNLNFESESGMENGNTVTVRKAIKPFPAAKIIVEPYPEQPLVGGYYLKKKLQGIPLHGEDTVVATAAPNRDDGFYVFLINNVILYDKDDIKVRRRNLERCTLEKLSTGFGGIRMVTPDTSFEEVRQTLLIRQLGNYK